jgi:anti-sigma regulatory factor (Ser/Thr protein kinase)
MSGSTVQCFFNHAATTPSQARQWASRIVGDEWGFTQEVAYEVSLVVSELVTNAVEHVPRVVRGCARGIMVELEAGRAWLRVEVHDADGKRRPEARTPNAEAEGGRGLLLVAGLARRWGVEQRQPFGKVIWAELPTSGTASEAELPITPMPAEGNPSPWR